MPDQDVVTRLNAALEGRYRIERQLGEGGMATVYLADDLRHERKVALKVLKPELAAVVGAERFLAEIKTTANLQHPHILPLHDSGEAASFLFYVMPYVEGESLRERLDRERQLPVDEAVRITTSVAEALDHAHRHGVIHRDIKPANILLLDGQPVLSDFGIALAVGAAGGGRLTETGLSLGTPHYMSPEQATGDQVVGRATDIYALGCVLYEMLTGEPPYTGSTAQAILGKIIQAKPVSATEARRSVPANVDAAIRKALEKLSADRFASAKDFAKALADPGFHHGEAGLAALAAGGGWTRRSVAFASLFGLTALLLVWSLVRTGPAATTTQTASFTVPVGEGADVYLGGVRDAGWGRPSSRSLALSPDGRLLAYAAWALAPDGQTTSRLYLRRIDREEAVPLEGTEGASSPFFSPDGAWIGFLDSLSLRRVSVVDRDVERIAQDADPSQDAGLIPLFLAGAAWSEDGVIAYAVPDGIYRVPAAGGAPELILKPDTVPGGLGGVGQPEWLPDGRVLLLAGRRSGDLEGSEIFALDPATGERTTVITNALDPHYVEPGILVFMRLGTMMAVAFDPSTLEVRGEPVAVVEDVMQALSTPNQGWDTGIGQFALSRAGHLAYASGGLYPPRLITLWRVHADGTTDSLALEPRRYLHLRLSPDGTRLAFSAGPGPTLDVFVYDFNRRVAQRLNTGFSISYGPEWSSDGREIAFTAAREDGVRNIYRMPVDGSGPPEPLAPSDQGQLMGSWSATGAIAYLQTDDIWILPPGGEPAPFVASDDADEMYPAFSPDGRWLAYALTQGGRVDVYVRPYPGPGPATLVSVDRGTAPVWARDGRRLYYWGPQGDPPHAALMAVDVDAGDDLKVGRAVALIDPWQYGSTVPIRGPDVAADGSFIAARQPRDAGIPGAERVSPQRISNRVGQIHVVLNWAEELRARVPAN